MDVFPISGLPEIVPGCALARALGDALETSIEEGLKTSDILVVTQKIVSKAEGRFVELSTVTPSTEARKLADTTRKDPRLVELVLRESSSIVRAVPGVLITRHLSGHVMANAGIDRSNIGDRSDDTVLLLPKDADGSAAAIRIALRERFGLSVAVVISDSFGRPWRHGVTQVAIGAAGLPALDDRRGEPDRDGRLMEVTQIGIADMVACAAGLVMGEGAEGVPVALVRGLDCDAAPHCDAAALVRPLEEDLFR